MTLGGWDSLVVVGAHPCAKCGEPVMPEVADPVLSADGKWGGFQHRFGECPK